MRIVRIEIERFLGFKKLVMDLNPDLQLVAGPNNAGKSSLIRCLDAFFADPGKTSMVDLLPLNGYYKALGARTLSTIQVWFSELSKDEAEAFESIQRRDGRMWIKLKCSKTGSVTFEASQKPSADEARRLYEEALSRFNFVKIPSVRVAGGGEESPESLARLLDTLETVLIRTGSSRSTNLQQEFVTRLAPLESLVKDVLDQSADAIMADLPFQEERVRFRLPEARHALRGMLESAVIESDGDATIPITERGTGFQSALVLGILRYVAEKESAAGGNLMFAIEEPEAFLHPQTQRAMAKVISDISSSAQVLMTTHSAVLVDSYGINRIARLPLQAGGTTHMWRAPALGPVDEGRLSRYCSAANSELIFANAVVFVEGEGDFAVLEKLLGRACGAPGGHYALGITVVEAAGLSKIQHLVQLSQVFGVRSYVLADRDSLHKTGGKRELLDILKLRPSGLAPADQASLLIDADEPLLTIGDALANQASLNAFLQTRDVFVLSSDLEGLLLDSLGVDRLADVLRGEGAIDEVFAKELKTAPDGYEQCAAWLGSKGWNSDRKKAGKMKPHLAPVLAMALFEGPSVPSPVVEPLTTWLAGIVEDAHLTPL